MSRPCVPGMRPAVTSWFLLALTALAALLGSGLEVGGPAGAVSRELAAAGSPEQSSSPEQQSTGATDARVPFVGAVLGGAPPAPAAGSPSDASTVGSSLRLDAPLGVLERPRAQAGAPSYVLVGGSGRAPPVTSGT